MSPYLQLVMVVVSIALLLGVYLSIRRKAQREPSFTAEAEKTIAFARVEAESLESPEIEPVHLLLGLMRLNIPAVTRFVPPEWNESIRAEVKDHLSGGAIVSYRDDLPFSDDARLALVAAAREAKGLSSPQIDAPHLLLGLLHSEKSLAALMLRERGLRLESLRAAFGGWQE